MRNYEKLRQCATSAGHEEVMTFIVIQDLAGAGMGYVDMQGYVDMHLLASALFSRPPLWTADRSLGAVAKKLGIEYKM